MEMVAANYTQQESRIIASGTEKQLPKQRTQIMINIIETRRRIKRCEWLKAYSTDSLSVGGGELFE